MEEKTDVRTKEVGISLISFLYSLSGGILGSTIGAPIVSSRSATTRILWSAKINGRPASTIIARLYPEYAESAEISAVSSLGEAGSIEATIGLKTSQTTLSRLIEDIKKNATGQKVYSLVSILEE